MKLIKSISYNQFEIIENIIKLHVPQGYIDCDPTYSKGNFYKNNNIIKPKYKYDILPQLDEVEKADARNLPLNDNSLNCIMFDPPFLATTGKSLNKDDDSNIINKRFGVYPNEKSLHNFYVEAMKEFYRILKPKGILIFKCQDKNSSSKQYMSHCFIYENAIEIGFYPKDLFVLLAKIGWWLIGNYEIKNMPGNFTVIFGYLKRIVKKWNMYKNKI